MSRLLFRLFVYARFISIYALLSYKSEIEFENNIVIASWL